MQDNATDKSATETSSACAALAARGQLTLTLWTNDGSVARQADRAGVDRVGLDLEVLGKSERQAQLESWVSTHRLAEIDGVREVLQHSQLFVRTNPLHAGTQQEVDSLLQAGAEVLMLPYFTRPADVREFSELVDGRARIVPLLETAEAAEQIDEIVQLEGFDEIHIGLTDLSLSMGCKCRFGCLFTPLMAGVVQAVHAAGIKLGLGSLGRAMDDSLAISADLMYAQLARHRASGVLLGRSFLKDGLSDSAFCTEVARLRQRWCEWLRRPIEEIEAAHGELRDHVA